MRLACLLLVSSGALAQVGLPLITSVGPLSCGLRLYVPGQVQTYCYYLHPPSPPKIVCNALHIVTPATPGDSLPVAASQSCFATDPTGGNIYEVTWLVWQPIVALPPNSTGTIRYQVAGTSQACTVNSDGACVANPGSSPVTKLQQGSFSSGVVAPGLTTVHQDDGVPDVRFDLEPQAQWNFAYSPLMPVISTSQFATAITPTGLCVAITPEPGTAHFGITAEGLALNWFNPDWCPGGFDNPPFEFGELIGNCSFVPMTFVPPNSGQDKIGGPRCSAIPTVPTRMLAQVLMDYWHAAPTVQGR